ncbi:MAG: InlB B-repeat-containing protein [Paludibacteraceae bacterium]|nr:InlB B-repeat-containing protein [Paludibacteraceae bacterium]
MSITVSTPACADPSAPGKGSVTSTGATISEGTSGNYNIYYSTSSSTPSSSTSALATISSGTSVDITGLKYGTTYYYWAQKDCGGGSVSNYVAGSPTSFTTSCPAPTSIAAGTITNNGATFTITDSNSPTITSFGTSYGYDIYWSKSSTTPDGNTTPSASVTDGTFTYAATGLDAGATYYFWVRGKGPDAKSSWVAGTGTTFTTLHEYTLSYKETDGTANGSGTVVENATSFTNTSAPSKTGHDLEGFYAENTLTTKVANNSRQFVANVSNWTGTGGAYTKGENANLYLKWTPQTYTISSTLSGCSWETDIADASYEYTGDANAVSGTVNPSSGKGCPSSITVTMGGSTLTPSTDYTWSVSTAGVGTFMLKKVITGDVVVTITAQPMVKWMAGGQVFASKIGTAGTALTDPGTPSNSTYCDGVKVFVGWSALSIDGTTDTEPGDLFTSVSGKTIPAGGATYYAVFATVGDFVRVTNISQLSAGKKIVIVDAANSKVLTTTPGYANAPSEESSKITPSANMIWTLEASSANWKLKAGSSYLGVTSTSNGTSVSLTSTNSTWNIGGSSNTTYTNCYYLRNTAADHCCLEYYSSSPQKWCVYNSKSHTSSPYLTEKLYVSSYSAYATTCCQTWAPPTLSYSVPSGWKNGDSDIVASIGSGTTYGSVTWESSDASVLTVNSSGEIHAVGAGTAIVTATWAGDGTHCSQSRTSAVITVNGNVAVSFNANGGSLGTTSQSIPYNTATNLTTFANLSGTAPNCKRFDHWNTANDNSGTSYTDGQSVTLTAGLTLYAIYSDITYAVSDGTMVGVASHSYSANPITCGNTLTITCAADEDHKGNPTVTATGTHGDITVASATSVTIANVTSAIAVSISYAEKSNVTATWHAASGSIAGGSTTTQKEGTTFTLPNVTSVDCGTFLGWTNAANSDYSSTSGKPATFYNVGSTIALDANTDFYAVYSKVGDNPVADVLYHHADDGTDLDDDDHTGVTATGSGLGAYSSGSYYLKFDGIGDYIIFELDGVPTSFNMKLKTMTGGSYPYNVGFTLYESDSKSGPWTAIGSEVTASGGSQTFEIDITTAASFSKRVLKVEMTTRNINVGGGEITINGLRAAINYTTNPGCVDWVLDAINVTTAPTKTTYNECEAFDPTGMAVTATMKENGNPSNTTTKDVAGYTWTPTQFLTPGNSIPVTISYTEKDVTKTTTTNVKVTDLPNYTITFHDGDNTFTWTQSNHCDACDLDSRTGSLACGEYTFAGWSTSSTSYDDVSATISTWVSGSYTPTANTHLYAVYRKGAAPAEFTANCIGGTFTIGTKNGGSTIISHAANVGSFNSYEYGVANSDYTEDQLGKFLFEKVGENTYKISLERNDDYGGGIKRFYIAPDDYSAGAIEFLETYDANQCKWKVIAGTSGSWRIYTEFRNSNITKDYGIAGRGNDGATPRFRLVPTGNINGSDNYDVELSPVTVPVYQSNPNCASTYTITFNTHGGTFIQGNYAYETETTSGLSGETTSKFPSATLSGCTFAGWKEGSAFEETTSSAAEDDMSDAPYGLYAADADLSVSSNKTYHAVYHYYDDDIEFDPIEGGTYHMYATDGGVKHFCSGTPGTSFGTLTSTTDCEEVVDVVITPGTGENAGKYKINIGGYDVTPELTNTGLKRGTFWWNISEVSENLYHITADGAESGRSLNYYSAMSSFTHYKDNGGSQAKDISFGRCRQHHWTSEPTLTPLIILGATSNITITSTKDQAVKSNTKLKVSATHFGTTTTINLTCNIAGVTLSPSSLTTGADGEMVEQEVDVIYTPTSYPAALSDGITSGTITAQDANVTPLSTATRSVKVRNLPAQFVIAAKAGNEWVALTAKVGGMATQDAIPIMVDNTTMPTKATVAMNTSEYSLLGLPSTNSRFATNGGAVHLYSSQTSKVLNSSTSTSTATYINTGATAANAATSDNCLFYEWKLISNDLVHYTITNSNATAGLESNRILGYSASTGKWGMYSIGVNQDIFLLPIEEVLTDLNVEVMEWGATSMALRFEGAAPTSLKVTLGGSTSAAKTLTAVGEGSDLWKIDGLTLTSHDCEVMQLTDGTDASKGSLIRKPILVNSSVNGSAYRTALTDETCASCDIVILNGGKLTADQSKDNHTDFAKIHIYPGGKLVLDGNSLGVKQKLYVRGGYSWLNTSTYALPELYIKGNIKFNGSAKIIYDYYIQNYKYYQFTLPYTVPLSQVTDEAGIDNFPVWVKHYNGALRAVNANATSWEWYEGEDFEAGIGYIIAARPRQVDKVKNRPLSIIRFPLTNNAFTGNSTADYGEATKSVSTTAHGIAGYKAGTVTANNVGWNFIGNPFMATWKGDIGHQQLVKDPDEEHWNGSYKWADGATKYITVMSPEDGTDYDQYVASTTELKPFFPFYFQETAEGGSGTLEFANTGRQKKTPAAIRANDLREAFVQIDMTDGTSQDQTGVYVGDKYSDELDFDDMQKMFGSLTTKPKVWIMHDETRMAFEAMSEERAASNVPVGYRAPVEGEYTFALSNYSELDNVESVLLNDNELGIYNYDLLSSDYEFESGTVLYNDTRFTLRVVLKDENTGTPTGTETINLNSEEPLKFIYHDKMYILRGGVIYDATGKKVGEINK